MAAYFVSDACVKDAEALEVFRARAAVSIAQHGGRYLARAGHLEPVEGDWRPSAVVIIEFPDLERARTWYRSPEYASALAVRDDAISRSLVLVDGFA